MWKWLSPFFVFTTNERKTIVVLLVAMVAFISYFKVYTYFIESSNKRSFTTADSSVLAFMKAYEESRLAILAKDSVAGEDDHYPVFDSTSYAHHTTYKSKLVSYFNFDPNTIGAEEWVRLGLSAKQAAVVANFKAKGGKFRTAEDIRKIRVISEKKANDLIPYIVIAKTNEANGWVDSPKPVFAEKPKLIVDINLADSTTFDLLRGIGPSLARRIINYRERLGGFVAVSQISEVWQMPDSTYKSLKDRFTLTQVDTRKVNINVADVELMKKHPYLGYYHSKSIVAYRSAHGDFKKLEELKEVHTITDSAFQRILPYISLK